MTPNQMLHPHTLTVIVAIVLAVSLATGKTFNPVGFLTPVIVGRSSHPRLYWAGVALLTFFVIGSWLFPY